MKRFVIVLLAIALATFAFAEGVCLKGYLNGGIIEPGMIGTGIGAYTPNNIETGYNVRFGVRAALNDFYVMPEALPLEVQVGFGFQQNPKKGSTEDMMAFKFNADLMYPIDQVICIPVIDITPFAGLIYDYQLYETYGMHTVGAEVGVMFDVNVSKKLAVELTLGNPFNFDWSAATTRIWTSQAYANLGLSYVFEL